MVGRGYVIKEGSTARSIFKRAISLLGFIWGKK